MGSRHSVKLIAPVAVTVGALLACSSTGITLLPTPSPTPCAGWAVVPSPNVASTSSSFSAVAARTQDDAWAVGDVASANNTDRTLTEHWTGSQWQIVASPNIGGHDGLSSVAAIPQSISQSIPQAISPSWWAVGTWYTASPVGNGLGQTLILRWARRGGWTIVPSPNVASMTNLLYSVSADSPIDAWAVGLAGSPTGGATEQGLIEHWDGATWSIVPGPAGVPEPYALKAVIANSPADVWAVGYAIQPNHSPLPLAAHWDGTNWTLTPTPPQPAGSVFGELNGVSAVPGTSRVWAVGLGGAHGTLAEIWSGSGWTLVPSTGPSGLATLNAVTAVSAGEAWAVGDGDPGSLSTGGMSLIERWTAKQQWSLVTHPHPGTYQETLQGIAWVPTTPAQIWAVGSYSTSATANTQTLVERYC